MLNEVIASSERLPGEQLSGDRRLAEDCEVPLYFSSAGRALFGWLHHSRAPRVASLGLVICKPFGTEAICSHRSVRAFAEAAASAGVPVLRFDYAGTGDSEDLDADLDQLQTWVGDIVAAAGELKRCAHVEQVCLLGFRLGALLAGVAASTCKDATQLIAVAPVIDGSQYLRELRTIHRVGWLADNSADAVRPAVPEVLTAPNTGGLRVGGFPLSAASVATLSRLDLNDLRGPPLQDILVIDRSERPSARPWTEAMSARGVRSEYRCLPGFIRSMMTEPYFSELPTESIKVVREWLLSLAATRTGDSRPSNASFTGEESAPRSAALRLTRRDDPQEGVVERAVFLSLQPRVFGILTEPIYKGSARKAVLLLNDGANQHVSSNRMHVEFARSWGQRGYFVLRMDLAGLGDSETRPGQRDNEVFPPAALDDIRAAVDFLRSRYGVREVTLAGVCAGAYHSLRAAAAGVAVSRIILINPLNFYWRSGTSLRDVQVSEAIRNPEIYRERVRSIAAWKKLLTGGTNVWRILLIYVHRAVLEVELAMRRAARSLGIYLPRDLGKELHELVARGVRIAFVFGRGEPGIELLRVQGGWALQRLGDRCRVHLVDAADHIFSGTRARRELERILSAELFGNPAADCGGAIDPAQPTVHV